MECNRLALALWIAIKVSKTTINHAASVTRRAIFPIAEAAHVHVCNLRSAIDAMSWPEADNYQIHKVYHKVEIEGIVKALQGGRCMNLGQAREYLPCSACPTRLFFLVRRSKLFSSDRTSIRGIIKTLESIDPNDHIQRQKLFATGFSIFTK